MNIALEIRNALVVVIVLAITQFACNFSAQTPDISPQQLPASGAQATQAPAAAKSERGTPDEAKAMLQLAVDHYNSVGREHALADFTAGTPPFKDRDLYVACIDSHLIQSANGGYPNLVGSSVEPLSRAAWDSASSSSIGSVNYQWLNPVSGKTEPKTLYYEKVGTDVCGVGAYNP